MENKKEAFQKEWDKLEENATMVQNILITTENRQAEVQQQIKNFPNRLPEGLMLEDGVVKEVSSAQYLVIQAHTYEEGGYHFLHSKKKKWEVTDDFLKDLETLTTHLTTAINTYVETGDSSTDIVMTKEMFLTDTFKNLTKHAFGHEYAYLSKEKRYQCDAFTMLAQLLAFVEDEEQENFHLYQEIADTMFDFFANAKEGTPFTFNQEHHYMLTHNVQIGDETQIDFCMSIMGEKEYSLL